MAERQATVTYFHHSGFSVGCGDTLLIFDYWRGDVYHLRMRTPSGKSIRNAIFIRGDDLRRSDSDLHRDKANDRIKERRKIWVLDRWRNA